MRVDLRHYAIVCFGKLTRLCTVDQKWAHENDQTHCDDLNQVTVEAERAVGGIPRVVHGEPCTVTRFHEDQAQIDLWKEATDGFDGPDHRQHARLTLWSF